MWCVPTLDKEYKEKMLDVLEVYERPYNCKKPVVCLDEKSTQLLGATVSTKSMSSTGFRKVDYEYKRNGTANIFVSVEPLNCTRAYRVTKKRTGKDFAKFLRYLVESKYKEADKVVLVMDNLNTHTEKSLKRYYGKAEGKRIASRIEWHYTPKHASWLNMAETEISMISRAVLRRRLGDIQKLKRQVKVFQGRQDRRRATIKWQFTRTKARAKFDLCGTK